MVHSWFCLSASHADETTCGSVIHCLFTLNFFLNEYFISPPQRPKVNAASKSRAISQIYYSSTYLGQSNSSKCFSHSAEICGGRDEMSSNKTRVASGGHAHYTLSWHLNHPNHPSHSLHNDIVQRERESPPH